MSLKGASLLLTIVGGTALYGFEDQGSLGSVAYRVFAPDWIWRGEAMSVLLIVHGGETPSDRALAVRARLALPAGVFKEGDEGVVREITFSLSRGSTRRFAFKELVPRVDAPTAVHRLQLTFELEAEERTAGGRKELAFDVRTVRGPLVPGGIWSLLAPAGIAVLALPVFLLVLRRHGRAAWWKELPPPVAEEREGWWSAKS